MEEGRERCHDGFSKASAAACVLRSSLFERKRKRFIDNQRRRAAKSALAPRDEQIVNCERGNRLLNSARARANGSHRAAA